MRSSVVGCTLLAAMTFAPALGYAEDPAVIARDRARIQAHLRGVEEYLREQDTSHLTELQQTMRAETIERLREYWAAGVFPRNTVTDYPTPVFVDPGGRPCAVGHLMLEAGYGDAVDEIVKTQNLEYVETIESSGVAAWLEESGITGQEAAWIQPQYNPCNDECDCESDPVCAEDGTTYVSPCFAEQCFRQVVYEPGCCEDTQRIVWSEDLLSSFGGARICPEDPNDSLETLCATVVEPPPVDSDACSAATSVRPTRWLGAVLLVSLFVLRRRQRVS